MWCFFAKRIESQWSTFNSIARTRSHWRSARAPTIWRVLKRYESHSSTIAHAWHIVDEWRETSFLFSVICLFLKQRHRSTYKFRHCVSLVYLAAYQARSSTASVSTFRHMWDSALARLVARTYTGLQTYMFFGQLEYRALASKLWWLLATELIRALLW